nr:MULTISPECIES: hypothetical protein [unclassified Lentimonas]
MSIIGNDRRVEPLALSNDDAIKGIGVVVGESEGICKVSSCDSLLGEFVSFDACLPEFSGTFELG